MSKEHVVVKTLPLICATVNDVKGIVTVMENANVLMKIDFVRLIPIIMGMNVLQESGS